MKKALIGICMIALYSCNFGPKNEPCGASTQISKVSYLSQIDNVLRYDVSYQLSDTRESYIKFWEKINPNNVNYIKVNHNKDVNTTLYGLKSNTVYEVQIVLEKMCETGSDIVEIKTGELPYKELSGYVLTKNTGEFKGFAVFHQTVSRNGHLYVIVNDEAQVVWYQYFNRAVNTFSWTPDKTLLALLDKDELIEIDLMGNKKLSLSLGELGFDKKMHHEIQKNELGHIYGITYEKRALNSEEKSMYGIDTLSCDGILVLDSLGNKLWKWSMCHTELPDIDNFNKEMANDWGHANALYDDRKGNFLMSYRNFNQIWSVNKSKGEVNWKFGDNGSFEIGQEDNFHGQHAVHINREGHMMLFDNGDKKRAVSRALSFNIIGNNQYEKILDVKLPRKLFSYKKGNVQLINDEHVFFNSTQASTLAVSKTNDSIIWQLKLPQQAYRAEYINNLYD